MHTRRSFLASLAALPLVGRFVKVTPVWPRECSFSAAQTLTISNDRHTAYAEIDGDRRELPDGDSWWKMSDGTRIEFNRTGNVGTAVVQPSRQYQLSA